MLIKLKLPERKELFPLGSAMLGEQMEYNKALSDVEDMNQPLVRGMEIDVEAMANEIRIFDGNNDKGAGAIAEHLKANAHVWLKEKGK